MKSHTVHGVSSLTAAAAPTHLHALALSLAHAHALTHTCHTEMFKRVFMASENFHNHTLGYLLVGDTHDNNNDDDDNTHNHLHRCNQRLVLFLQSSVLEIVLKDGD